MLLLLSSLTPGLTTPQLRVCTVSTCGRNGGAAFCEAAQSLSAGSEVEITPSGCMSRCNGIVVRTAGGTTSLPLRLDKEDAIAALESAASFLEDAGMDTKALARVLIAKERGDEAMCIGDLKAAVAFYTEVIESPMAADLLAAQAQDQDDGEDEPLPPVFRLTGRAAQNEEDRWMPRRVRWLYDALVGRSRARCQLGDASGVADAQTDARHATSLCALAGGGWYRLHDAARRGADEATAAAAAAELTRLGYALDVEGPQPTEAERRALEQAAAREAAAAERERLAAVERAGRRAAQEARRAEEAERRAAADRAAAEAAAEAERAAAEAAAEAARIEAEWNTPEAVAARAVAAATEALGARLAAARGAKAAEEVLHAYKWSGRGRRQGMLDEHAALLGGLAAAAAEAEAAGVGGEGLEEVRAALKEMQATKRAMEEM